MKYISWAIAVTVIGAVLCFSAKHFNKPDILLGLIGIYFLPHPFDEDDDEEDEEPTNEQ